MEILRPRSSAEPKSPLEIGKIQAKEAIRRKKVTIGGITYVREDRKEDIRIIGGGKVVTFYPDGRVTRMMVLSGKELEEDPRDVTQPKSHLYSYDPAKAPPEE